jgi:hypothetical protein
MTFFRKCNNDLVFCCPIFVIRVSRPSVDCAAEPESFLARTTSEQGTATHHAADVATIATEFGTTVQCDCQSWFFTEA